MKHKSMEKKLIICLSGGLDSSVAYQYALKEKGYKPADILCLWFDIGQPYNKKEKESLDKLGIPYKTINMDLIRNEFNNIHTKIHPNQIIPGRNLIFATIAASFGKRIWMMALDGETHLKTIERDKSTKFFKDTTAILTYIFNVKRNETIIESPFYHMSKTEVVKWAVSNNVAPEWLRMTSTCYDEKLHNCGECATCFKRWISMENNGVREGYTKNPWESNEAKTLIKKYVEAHNNKDYSHYSEKRIYETFNALEKVGVLENEGK